MSRNDRFVQPLEAIHLIERVPRPSDDPDVMEGLRRIGNGEDADAVWSDIAAKQIASGESDDAALTALEEKLEAAIKANDLATIGELIKLKQKEPNHES